ncbi:MAG: dicarboxylate/amino acid:cation symporter [Bacteroidia bacterium]|nr:dicarboxylate/amino acid:cation symporter [Bacteroidia bacterium]
MMKNKLTIFILVGMVLGILSGYLYSKFASKEEIEWFASHVILLSDIFLRLIKMIIGPLVLSTLAVGIAKLGDIKAVGRIGLKTIGWFIGATIISLSLGLILINFFEPGVGLKGVALPGADAAIDVVKDTFPLKTFINHLIPENIFSALSSHKEILQIVVFSIFFGIATAAIGEKGQPVIKALDSLAHIMLKITNYVMGFAPFAVFGAIAATVAKNGLDILFIYSKFIGEFYFGLLLLWIILIALGSAFVKKRIWTLLKYIREPLMIAFSTASSESAYPKLLNQLERFGCRDRISSFVLPLGYSFNLDGSMMYMTFGSIFIAQMYGIHLSFVEQVTMLLTLMITSKGIAGVPRASLVVVAATISSFGIPEAGIALLLPIDQFLDMGRSATNVVGNAMATVAVSKMEGELDS